MDAKAMTGRPWIKPARWIARVLLILWAGFWLYFNIGSAFYWYGKAGPQGIVVHLVMVAVISLLFLAAWFLELLGGILLIALAGLTFYQWGLHWPLVALTLCAPPFLMGFLFIICWFRSPRQRKPAPEMSGD